MQGSCEYLLASLSREESFFLARPPVYLLQLWGVKAALLYSGFRMDTATAWGIRARPFSQLGHSKISVTSSDPTKVLATDQFSF